MFFLFFLILDSISWSNDFIYYIPSFSFLFFIYRILFLFHKIKIWLIFFFGIIVDIIQDFNLGVHSFSYILVYFFIFNKRNVFKNMILLKQCFFVFFLSLIVNFIVYFSLFFFNINFKIFLNSFIHGVVWFFIFKRW